MGRRIRGDGAPRIVSEGDHPYPWKPIVDDRAASIVPYRSYKTRDGDILFGGGNDKLFGVLCDRLGHPDWKTDARFVTNSDRVKHREEIDGLIENKTKQKTTQEWLVVFEGSGMPYAAVNDIQGTLNHSHGELDPSNFKSSY